MAKIDTTRGLALTAMKEGWEMGFDAAVELAGKLGEAFDNNDDIAREMKRMRAKVLAQMFKGVE